MIKTVNARIKTCNVCGVDLKNEEAIVSIDENNLYLDLMFMGEYSFDKTESECIDAIELLLEDGNIYTFYKCHLTKISKKNIRFIYEMSIDKDFVDNIDSLLCGKIEFVINTSPVPLVAIGFLPEESYIESLDTIVKCQPYNGDVSIMLELPKGMLSLEKLEKVFYNILDILFLGNGSYPYIINEILYINDIRIQINRLRQSIYKKGNSFAHWNKSIICARDLDLNKVYPIYLSIIDGNKLIVPVLSNVIHCNNAYSDMILCNLIQCVEGYMRKLHSKYKFSKNIVEDVKNEIEKALKEYEVPANSGTTQQDIIDSVRGMIGRINEPSFKECLENAIHMNQYTKEVFYKEIAENELSSFLRKSADVRNQFSHMVPMKNPFEDGLEIYQAIEKYSMLLRILVLTDLDIKIHGSSIRKYITGVNSSK